VILVLAAFAVAVWGALPSVLFVVLSLRLTKRMPALHCCGHCGYDLRGIDAAVCPECGERVLVRRGSLKAQWLARALAWVIALLPLTLGAWSLLDPTIVRDRWVGLAVMAMPAIAAFHAIVVVTLARMGRVCVGPAIAAVVAFAAGFLGLTAEYLLWTGMTNP